MKKTIKRRKLAATPHVLLREERRRRVEGEAKLRNWKIAVMERDQLIEIVRQERDGFKGFTEDVIALVGDKSLLNRSPAHIPVDVESQRDADRWKATPKALQSYAYHDAPMETMMAVTMRLLHTSAMRDTLKHCMHFYAELADKKVGYMISEQALQRLSEHDLAVQIVGPMAMQLAKNLKEVYRR